MQDETYYAYGRLYGARGRTKPGIPASTRPVRGQVCDLVTARKVKFLGRRGWAVSREGNGGAPIGEPPPQGYEDDDALPF